MKGVLIKDNIASYTLFVDNKIYAKLDGQPFKTIDVVPFKPVIKKLSLENCQEIENGYDLVELFNEVDKSIDFSEFCFTSFKLGIKTAIELIRDKKFTEDAIYDSVMLGVAFEDPGIKDVETYNELKDLAIKRNTKNKWEVEIIMGDFIGISDNYTPENFPILDGKGCIILKKI